MSIDATIAAIYLKFLPFQVMLKQQFNAVSVKAAMSVRFSPLGASGADREHRLPQLLHPAVDGNPVFPELLDDRVPCELFTRLFQVCSLKNHRLFHFSSAGRNFFEQLLQDMQDHYAVGQYHFAAGRSVA